MSILIDAKGLLPNKVSIVLESAEDALKFFDKIKVFRAATSAGPFVEITDSGSRIALEPDEIVYEFFDTDGSATDFYTIALFNSSTDTDSDQSTPFLGSGDPALNILTVDELKTIYLFGLDLTDDNSVPFPDSLFEHYIKAAVSWVETKVDIKLTTEKIVNERHDYIREDFVEWIKLKTDHVPVQTIERVELILPGDQKVINFLPESITLFPEAGQLNIVPGTGQVAQIFLTQGGLWFPWIERFQRSVPLVWFLDYTTGFEDGKLPQIIKDAVGKYAAMGPLHIAGDLLGGAGIASQSIGLDGLTTSFNTTSSSTNSGYGARILNYSRELKEMIPQIRRTFRGIGIVVG